MKWRLLVVFKVQDELRGARMYDEAEVGGYDESFDNPVDVSKSNLTKVGREKNMCVENCFKNKLGQTDIRKFIFGKALKTKDQNILIHINSRQTVAHGPPCQGSGRGRSASWMCPRSSSSSTGGSDHHLKHGGAQEQPKEDHQQAGHEADDIYDKDIKSAGYWANVSIGRLVEGAGAQYDEGRDERLHKGQNLHGGGAGPDAGPVAGVQDDKGASEDPDKPKQLIVSNFFNLGVVSEAQGGGV